jgi:hypothetical protein
MIPHLRSDAFASKTGSLRQSGDIEFGSHKSLEINEEQ